MGTSSSSQIPIHPFGKPISVLEPVGHPHRTPRPLREKWSNKWSAARVLDRGDLVHQGPACEVPLAPGVRADHSLHPFLCARQSAGRSEYLSSAPLKWSSWPDIPASIRDDKTLDRRSCALLGEGIIYRVF